MRFRVRTVEGLHRITVRQAYARFIVRYLLGALSFVTMPARIDRRAIDEFFYLLEGAVTVTLLRGDSTEEVEVSSGETCVIPRGVWHRQHSAGQVITVGATVGSTKHSLALDPRREQ